MRPKLVSFCHKDFVTIVLSLSFGHWDFFLSTDKFRKLWAQGRGQRLGIQDYVFLLFKKNHKILAGFISYFWHAYALRNAC